MGELNIESIKNAAVKALAEQADAKSNGEEKSGNGKIDSVFEESVLRAKIREGLTNGTISQDDELNTLMESIGLKLTKKDKKAHKAKIKEEAADLVKDLTDSSMSHDAKVIKEKNEETLNKMFKNGDITEEKYEAAIKENKKHRSLWQLLRGERTTQSDRRHSVADRNKMNYRAYKENSGNTVYGRLVKNNSEYVEDGSERTYTKKEIVNGYEYQDPVSRKKIKVKGIGEKSFKEMQAEGFFYEKNGEYVAAKSSEIIRLFTGTDYNADTHKNPKDSEVASIGADLGLSKAKTLGIKNNKNVKKVIEWHGASAKNHFRIDGNKILLGAFFSALGSTTHEALRPKHTIDASTNLNVNDIVNIDLGSKELAQKYVNSYKGDAKVSLISDSVVQVVTKIGVFDPKVYTLAKDLLGAAFNGAITGTIGGFALALLDGKKSEESALPEINCTTYPTVDRLQRHLNNMVKRGELDADYARIAMMIAKANADENGKIDCTEFNKAIVLEKGNNIWNPREVATMGIDKPQTKPAESVKKEDDGLKFMEEDKKEEPVHEVLDVATIPNAKKYNWSDVTKIYGCFKGMNESQATRMMEVIQAIDPNKLNIPGHYNVDRIAEIVTKAFTKNFKPNHLYIKNQLEKEYPEVNAQTLLSVLGATYLGTADKANKLVTPLALYNSDDKVECERDLSKLKTTKRFGNGSGPARNNVAVQTGYNKDSVTTTTTARYYIKEKGNVREVDKKTYDASPYKVGKRSN